MRITATRIAQWAKTARARLSLPRLVRNLVHTAGTPVEAAFPAGDSTGLPGWDGTAERARKSVDSKRQIVLGI